MPHTSYLQRLVGAGVECVVQELDGLAARDVGLQAREPCTAAPPICIGETTRRCEREEHRRLAKARNRSMCVRPP